MSNVRMQKLAIIKQCADNEHVLSHLLCETSLWTDSFLEQLIEDSAFLKAERRLDTELVDKVILQLNRIYPQILSDKEATKVRPHTHSHTV